jgi:predicted nucleic-acid-binding protein
MKSPMTSPSAGILDESRPRGRERHLRFLRNDDPQQSPRAASLFQHAQSSDDIELVVSAVTLMEVFYVLTRAYELLRSDAAAVLSELLRTGVIMCPDADTVLAALARITNQKTSFDDGYLAASAAPENQEVATFDQGVASFKDIRLYPL